MKKSRIFTLIIFLVISSLLTGIFSLCAAAYTPSSFGVSAESALLVSLDGNTVLYENNADKRLYPAALVKTMVAVLLLEESTDVNTEKVTVTSSALNAMKEISYNAYKLTAGEQIPVIDLVYLIMLASSNEAAEVGAEYFGGGSVSNFIDMMNDKAAELGMDNTHFTNVTGLQDDNQYTTAWDMYKLAKYAMSFDTLKTVTDTRVYEMPATNSYNKTRSVITSNWLRDGSTDYYYRYATGLKTGYTDEAGRCLVASAAKDNKTYICVLLNSPVTDENGKDVHYEFTDAQNLFEWAFNDFTQKTVLTTGVPVGEAKVTDAWDTDYVTLYPADDVMATIPESADTSTIVAEAHLSQDAFEAPIAQGDVLGYVTVSYAGVVVGQTDLIASESVERSSLLSFWGQVKAVVCTLWFKLALIALILLIVIHRILRLIRRKLRKQRRKVQDYRRM